MKIRKMEYKRTFIVTCKEHNAEFECEMGELRVVSKRVFAYTCPICGHEHPVSSYNVTEATHYRHDVDLDDRALPVNIAKAAVAADEAIRRSFKKMRKVYKEAKRVLEADRNKKAEKVAESVVKVAESNFTEQPTDERKPSTAESVVKVAESNFTEQSTDEKPSPSVDGSVTDDREL